LVSDEALLAQFKEGDQTAFGQLVERYQQRAYGITYQMLGSLQDAEDISQEGFIRVYLGAESFRGDSKFYTWFYRILVNLCLDFLRQKSVRGRTVLPFWGWFSKKDPGESQPEEGVAERVHEERGWADPERTLSNERLRRDLFKALSELSPKQRAVFILRNNHDLSTQEIAAILKTSEGTVKTHLFRAIRALRARLSSYDEGGRTGPEGRRTE